MPSDPLDAIAVDRNGCCRWSEVTRAVRQYRERIEDLEEAMDYIHRHADHGQPDRDQHARHRAQLYERKLV